MPDPSTHPNPAPTPPQQIAQALPPCIAVQGLDLHHQRPAQASFPAGAHELPQRGDAQPRPAAQVQQVQLLQRQVLQAHARGAGCCGCSS
jgi:hypothetical protein